MLFDSHMFRRMHMSVHVSQLFVRHPYELSEVTKVIHVSHMYIRHIREGKA